MGNKVSACCAGTAARENHRRYGVGVGGGVYNDNLGHSFCYVPPVSTGSESSFPPDPSLRNDPIPGTTTTTTTTTFRSISGASVGANTSTKLSASPLKESSGMASGFESSVRFASLPLQVMPRSPIKKPGYESGLFERRFKSGPIESGFGKKKKTKEIEKPKKFSKSNAKKSSSNSKSIFANPISTDVSKKSVIERINGHDSPDRNADDHRRESNSSSTNLTRKESPRTEEERVEEEKIQWAQGKAGEDRVHVILSEEIGWLFVGIYDGFSGPDPPDFLLNNLYPAVLNELKGLLWNDKSESENRISCDENKKQSTVEEDSDSGQANCQSIEGENVSCGTRNVTENVKKLQWMSENSRSNKSNDKEVNHRDVLKALQQALKKTEEAFDLTVDENPELALMGSCVLVTLMKGEDVYVMSVGDSRAVLAQRSDLGGGRKKMQKELEGIKEESPLETRLNLLVPVQLNMEHSTSVEEEVRRLKKEHPDDSMVIKNGRVKGYLKVTRAFGAGLLKQPKWNDALLGMFRINYVGTSPYITCTPSLHHHRLTSRDKFLILSSDGLYEYFSNEEAIFEVDSFISAFPEGDPAQHLIQEVLLRAAKKYGMDFHELLEIPQGYRRRYHDDVSVIVISLEGRIWRSSM